ncbi:MAG: C-GCAxxG-C-C family protein [Deltaproteobacteria bacterium]|jgi:C_GCAxxG_C_C family probable redox protein|nr:C-GCAxxG-C-C family protein [Deltaproteobacteria bacterium]
MEVLDEGYLRLLELANQEFSCSQMLMQMCLENQGKDNPELIRAMGGLVGGLGYSGKLCGALSSGACLLSLYAGKGLSDEVADSRANSMVVELVEWFERDIGSQYGGIDCLDIMNNNPRNKIERCPHILLLTNKTVMEILDRHGYDLVTGRLEY